MVKGFNLFLLFLFSRFLSLLFLHEIKNSLLVLLTNFIIHLIPIDFDRRNVWVDLVLFGENIAVILSLDRRYLHQHLIIWIYISWLSTERPRLTLWLFSFSRLTISSLQRLFKCFFYKFKTLMPLFFLLLPLFSTLLLLKLQ